MSSEKLAFIDADLTAESEQLEEIAATVTKSDILALVEGDSPEEVKASTLLGLVRLLDNKNRDDLREFAKSELAKIQSPLSVEIPQITS